MPLASVALAATFQPTCPLDQTCTSCEILAALPTAGHGALLSPLPPGLSGLLSGLLVDMLNDPPGLVRSRMPAVDGKISAFFSRQLLP